MTTITPKDFYAVLEVSRQATPEEIRSRFRQLARERHPDRFQGEAKARAEQEFQLVTEAANVLLNPEKRRELQAKNLLDQEVLRVRHAGGGNRKLLSLAASRDRRPALSFDAAALKAPAFTGRREVEVSLIGRLFLREKRGLTDGDHFGVAQRIAQRLDRSSVIALVGNARRRNAISVFSCGLSVPRLDQVQANSLCYLSGFFELPDFA